ncbi:MAG: DUF1553 domain-containing protein [Bryobacteraceae bacterium]
MLRRAALGLLFLVGGLRAESANLYRDHVRPLLEKNCLMCHNGKVKQASLDLSRRESLLKGGEHGPVLKPGSPNDSVLYKVVAHLQEPHMPYKGKKLPDEVVGRIADWIKEGAQFEAVDEEAAEMKKRSDHWAFRPPVRETPPDVKSREWVRNPIDRFIAAELEKRGLSALPEADKRTLLRRVSLDLIGLPPAPEETNAFLNDKSADAYEKVVDRLLASPRHGERWGRHWLDIWRYSDWYGWRKQNQVRYSQRHIWRWRDWTVESVNRDKGYDRMILEMIAGDELDPGNPDTVRATGYLARSWYMFNRNVWLQDAMEYTSTSFLGLTMKCARCHTHKYDPITHVDYYRFRAFFEPHEVRTDRVAGEADVMKGGLARVYDAEADRPTYRFFRGNESNPDTANPLSPAVPGFFGVSPKIQPVNLPLLAYYPDGQSYVKDDLIAQSKAAIEKAEAELRKAEEALGKAKPEAAPKAEMEVAALRKKVDWTRAALPALEARITADYAKYLHSSEEAVKLSDQARALERQVNVLKAEENLIRGRFEFEAAKSDDKKLAAAAAKLDTAVKALNAAKENHTPIGKVYPATSTGRRLALARWIASKDNPLTARVAINHMWMRHFGKPLVPTVFNFGRSGKPASHPELLDWLALEFMERNWDMKAIHRLMVTSRAYRTRSSGWDEKSKEAAADPDNRYLWRMNVRRMEAEAVRDSVLHLAGKLDTAMGGEELDETKGHEIFRRSMYFRHSPDLQMDMLRVFDLASPNECFERGESIVPQQALALANGKLSLTMGRILAAHLPSGSEFVPAAFERILGRKPNAEELAESEKFLLEQTALYRQPSSLTAFRTGPAAGIKPSADPAARGRESLVHVLLNHNDFVAIR